MTTHDPIVVVSSRLSDWRAWLVFIESAAGTSAGLDPPIAAIQRAVVEAVKEATPDPIPPEPATDRVLIVTDAGPVIWHKEAMGWCHPAWDDQSRLSWRQLWESTAWERLSIQALGPALVEGDAEVG